MTSPSRIVSIKVVTEMTTLGKTSIYAGMRARTFPPSIRLGANKVGWMLSDIEAWIQRKVEESAAARNTQGKV